MRIRGQIEQNFKLNLSTERVCNAMHTNTNTRLQRYKYITKLEFLENMLQDNLAMEVWSQQGATYSSTLFSLTYCYKAVFYA